MLRDLLNLDDQLNLRGFRKVIIILYGSYAVWAIIQVCYYFLHT